MYSIEPDEVIGRVYWTDLGDGRQVSTVRLSVRDTAGEMGSLLRLCDSLLGRDGDLETAVLAPELTTVVASTDTVEQAEQNHRRAVENLLEGTVLPVKEPPMLRLLRQ